MEHYYQQRSSSLIQETACTAPIHSFTPVNGDTGPWLVSGTVTITRYEKAQVLPEAARRAAMAAPARRQPCVDASALTCRWSSA